MSIVAVDDATTVCIVVIVVIRGVSRWWSHQARPIPVARMFRVNSVVVVGLLKFINVWNVCASERTELRGRREPGCCRIAAAYHTTLRRRRRRRFGPYSRRKMEVRMNNRIMVFTLIIFYLQS